MNAPMISQSPTHRVASILAVSVLALGLSACGKNDEATVGQRMDSPVERTEQVATDTRTTTDGTAQNAGDRTEQAAASTQYSAEGMADRAKSAVDDATITAQVNASLAKDPDLSAVKIDVDTVNGAVTLNGPAPSTVARDRAETIAKAVTGVTAVNNQLVVTSG
jgi:hyperosmotically inducible protein